MRPLRIRSLTTACTVLSALLISAQPAHANSGDNYPDTWKNAPQDSVFDDWGEYNRECTSWVAWALHDRDGYELPFFADAKGFAAKAAAKNIVVDSTPAVGSVAWWDGASWNGWGGHIAFVDSLIKDDNGKVTGVAISEYNDPPGSGAYNTRTIKPDSPNGYIHFADTASAAASSPPPYINKRLIGDVNGDGRADAVVVFGENGVAKVALSTGSSFGYPGDWSYGQSSKASDYWLADVNGDGKADLVAYYKTLRKWFVSISSGSGFWSPVEWSYDDPSFGDFSRAFFADVNGDGKADKVEFMAASGNWFVSVSSGNGFWRLSSWIGGDGIGSTDQFVADFNGDGKADAAVYIASSGNWYVALSTGYSFGYPGQWSAGHGLGTSFRLVGDATGDGKADAIYYSNAIYKFWVDTSSGSGLWGLTEWSYDSSAYAAIDSAFTADVNGDGKADKILWYRPSGNWYVALSSGSGYWPFTLWISGHGAGS